MQYSYIPGFSWQITTNFVGEMSSGFSPWKSLWCFLFIMGLWLQPLRTSSLAFVDLRMQMPKWQTWISQGRRWCVALKPSRLVTQAFVWFKLHGVQAVSWSHFSEFIFSVWEDITQNFPVRQKIVPVDWSLGILVDKYMDSSAVQ